MPIISKMKNTKMLHKMKSAVELHIARYEKNGDLEKTKELQEHLAEVDLRLEELTDAKQNSGT